MSKPAKVHPMVAVPDAVRMVLQETGRVLLEQRQLLLESKENGKNVVGSGSVSTIKIFLENVSSWQDLLHCVLDKDVVMSEPGYPPYTASVMDGYAIRCQDFQQPTAATLPKMDSAAAAPTDDTTTKVAVQWTHQVIDKVYAGDTDFIEDTKKEPSDDDLPVAYYITTGAVVPDSCDCVVPIEDCILSTLPLVGEDMTTQHYYKIAIQSTATIQAGTWIRPIGCDIHAGSVVLPRGHVLDPVALGLIQQAGVSEIYIKRPVTVGVLSTGNELLRRHSHPQQDSSNDHTGTSITTTTTEPRQNKGLIPDVNRPVLLSLLSTLGGGGGYCCKPIDLGMQRDDDIHAVAKTIDAALETCDVIITTGGISMGETDIIERVLVDHCGGTLHFGRMHMKPGRCWYQKNQLAIF
jgi:molybdopterin biosynthesis enzyme